MKIKNPKVSTLVIGALSGLSLFTLASAASFLPDSFAKLFGLVGPSGVCASE